MPFGRLGAEAPTHEKVLAIPRADRAAVWGLVVLSALWSADALTDGWVHDEMVENNAPSAAEAKRLMRIGMDVGLVRGRARRRIGARSVWGWDIEVDHDDKLLHNRSAEEVALERGARHSKIPFRTRLEVYRRDGDQCRYCGVPVTQHDTIGPRGRHIDHVNGDSNDHRLDNLVVACSQCNGAKKDTPLDALTDWRLLPTPEDEGRAPHYTDSTRRQLVKHGFLPDPLQPRPTDGTTASSDAPRIARPVDENHRGSDLVDDVDGMIADHLADVGRAADGQATVLAATGTDPPAAKGHPPGVSRVGTGRAGSARAGSGGVGSGAARRRERGGARHRRPGGEPR